MDDATASSDAVRSVFSTLRSTDRGYDSVTVLNTCYRIMRREGHVGAEELHFGIQPKGTTRWHYSATDGFSLGVYRSADAGYSLRWREPGVLTRGEGWSYGWATNVPSHRNAYFAAIRVGEPDVTQCT